jgi:hypothetical protein
VLVLDVREPASRPHVGARYVVDWLQANDVDPYGVYRVEVLPDGDGALRVFEYHNIDRRRHFIRAGTVCDGTVQDISGVADDDKAICVLPPRLVRLAAALPPELEAHLR